MSSINVLVTFETKPESAHTFAQLLTDVSKTLLNVNGCDQAQAKVCVDNSQQFMILERWQSQEAHAVHLNKVIASGAWEEIAQHLSAAPVSRYYRDL